MASAILDNEWYTDTSNDPTDDLLNSFAFQNANVMSLRGCLRRAAMLKDANMPAMRVISAEKLAELGRIPRSNEQYAITAEAAWRKEGADASFGSPLAVVMMASHRWSRPNYCCQCEADRVWGSEERQSCHEREHFVGHPDDMHGSKAKALVQFAEWYTWWRTNKISLHKGHGEITRDPELKLYFWIDFCCVDQDNPVPEMSALPAYVSTCQAIVCLDSPEYMSRAWCQVELMMAYAFMAQGNRPLMIPVDFEHHGQDLHREACVLQNPSVAVANGGVTNPADGRVIEALQRAAVRSRTFSCANTCYRKCCSSLRACVCFALMRCCGYCGWKIVRDVRRIRTGRSEIIFMKPKSHNIKTVCV